MLFVVYSRAAAAAAQLAKYTIICKQRSEQKNERKLKKKTATADNSSSNNHTTMIQRKSRRNRRRRRRGSRKNVYKLQHMHTNKYYKNRQAPTITTNRKTVYTEIVATYDARTTMKHTSSVQKNTQQQINTLDFQRKAYTSVLFLRLSLIPPSADTTHSLIHSLSLSLSACLVRTITVRYLFVTVSLSNRRHKRASVCLDFDYNLRVCDDVLSAQNHFYYQVIYTICSQIQLIKLTHISHIHSHRQRTACV